MTKMRIDEIGKVLLVSTGGGRGASAAVARGIPAEPNRLTVVMDDACLAADPELAARLREWVPQRHESVRLVAPNAAVAAERLGGQVPAQVLAELLDADVIAPDGELAAVFGGCAFVLAEPHRQVRGWWRFRPGRPPEPGGRRFPAPDWERELSDFVDPGLTDLTVDETPAGLWAHWRGSGNRPHPADLAMAVPVQADSMALIVSRAGDPPVPAHDLRRLVQALPEKLLEKLVVVPYGDRPVTDAPLGAVASLAANRTLRVRTGLPLHLSGRGTQAVAVARDGVPTWAPFAGEIAWRPQGGSRVLSWVSPADQLLPNGPAQLLLNEKWLVEILEAGLWIREIDRAEGAGVVRQLPLDAQHCTVVIGACDGEQSPPPWRTIEKFLRRLPFEALSRLRIAVPGAAGEWFASAAARGCARALRVPLSVLTSAGRFMPWTDEAEPVAERAPMPSLKTKADHDEASSLLSFMDEIRRTPAWDEVPVVTGDYGTDGIFVPVQTIGPVAQPGPTPEPSHSEVPQEVFADLPAVEHPVVLPAPPIPDGVVERPAEGEPATWASPRVDGRTAAGAHEPMLEYATASSDEERR